MIMDVQCECGVYFNDSGDKCYNCGRPKSEFILKVQGQHRRAKQALVAQKGTITDERIVEGVNYLSSSVRMCIEAEKRIGPHVPEELIERAFQKPT